jgi:hypothetical protein
MFEYFVFEIDLMSMFGFHNIRLEKILFIICLLIGMEIYFKNYLISCNYCNLGARWFCGKASASVQEGCRFDSHQWRWNILKNRIRDRA